MPMTPCLLQKPENYCCYGCVSSLWTLKTPVFMVRKRWRHDVTMSSENSQGYLWIPCEFYSSFANQIMCNKQSAFLNSPFLYEKVHFVPVIYSILLKFTWCAPELLLLKIQLLYCNWINLCSHQSTLLSPYPTLMHFVSGKCLRWNNYPGHSERRRSWYRQKHSGGCPRVQ